MFKKISFIVTSLLITLTCPAANGIPDGTDWFIQPLSVEGHFFGADDIQVSDTYVIFGENRYYDGTGIYELRYNNSEGHQASLSGSSIVFAAAGGIVFQHLGYRQLFPVTQGYYGNPDVYTDLPSMHVAWEAGPGLDQTQVYYNESGFTLCLTNSAQCFYNGKCPKVSAGTVAWLSNDGNDDEVFVLKNNTITQLTFNDIDECGLLLADNGDMVWSAWHTDGPLRAHYYDGEHVHQLSVGQVYNRVWAISEMGVLYSKDFYDGYNEKTNLVLHDGTKETILFESSSITDGVVGAALGGNSIAWIGRQTWTDEHRVYFMKGTEVISWPLLWSHGAVGVWGNRLVWENENTLYFGEYQGSPACVNRPQMDGSGDCLVNLADFVIFAGEWLKCGYDDPAACQ